MKELSAHAKVPADLHKPGIDEVKWKCKCGGNMRRVPEVLDVWFDSGVSSWAALGYPQNDKLFKEFWPADLNLEGTDQVRGWWNSELITSMICFDRAPFKSIVVHGMVLDIGKVKMSKSLGNIVQPSEVIAKYNRDYLRFFLVKESKGEDFAFDWKEFDDISKFFNTFWNSYNYLNMYLEFDTSTFCPRGTEQNLHKADKGQGRDKIRESRGKNTGLLHCIFAQDTRADNTAYHGIYLPESAGREHA
jgi:isoleucyl-tRNA synthetase